MTYLRHEKLWSNNDPLFPKTLTTISSERRFEHVELGRDHWATATPIREIFRAAFAAAGLPYFNPHSLRNTLLQLGQQQCQSPEQLKAWSQNLGHEEVLTTLYSYGTVSGARQHEILRTMAEPGQGGLTADANTAELLKALLRQLTPITAATG